MQRNRYDQSVATNTIKVEEKETQKMLHNIGDFVLSPTGKAATYWACFGIGIAFALMAVGYDLLWLMLPAFGFGGAGAGGVMMLAKRLDEFSPVGVIERREEFAPVTPPTGQPNLRFTFDLGNGRSPQVINQPRPNAFRSWLRAVLENGRVQFSQNQAVERGWSIDGYQILVQQLKDVGLLHSSETKNSAPICTETGKQLARRWLKK